MILANATVRCALLLAMIAALTTTVAGAFPSSFGGCPTAPKPVPLRSSVNDPLPPAIAEALQRADVAASLMQKRGQPVVESGLWTTPTSSLSVGVVYDQELIFSSGYGLRNVSDPSSGSDEHTQYRIGSISKIFAMLATMVTRDAGKLSLDSPVRQFVPEFRVKPAPGTKTTRDITFRQLATHMAGLSRESPCGQTYGCLLSTSEAFARVANTTQILPQDTMPVYSNMGFDVLGQATALVNNLTYEDMIDTLILEPLGLNGTGVNVTGVDPDHIAHPYLEGMKPCPPDQCLSDFGWANPSGAMYSSVADLAKIVQLMFRDDQPADSKEQILDGATLRETLLPVYITPDREGGYGLTWELYRIGDYMIRTKRGDVNGYASEMIMVPELKLGIVVLASMVEHAQDTAQTLTNILLPVFDAWLRTAAPVHQQTHDLSAYVGTYSPQVLPERAPVLHVTTDQHNRTLLFDWVPSVLAWAGTAADNDSEHLFRMMPWPGQGSGPAGNTCTRTESGDWWEFVKFQMEGDQAVSLSLDITMGETWVRH